eukprot:7377512-Prymnesium_polylepis.1
MPRSWSRLARCKRAALCLHEREPDGVGPVRRAASKDSSGRAAEARRLRLRLDHLVPAVVVEDKEQPHMREGLEAGRRVRRVVAPCHAQPRARGARQTRLARCAVPAMRQRAAGCLVRRARHVRARGTTARCGPSGERCSPVDEARLDVPDGRHGKAARYATTTG